MFNSRKVKAIDLLLWDENSRLPDKLSQEDQSVIRKTLLQNIKFGVLELATLIVKDFDLPQLEKIVVVSKDKRLVTYEGNRRVLAYQCLINPALALEKEPDFKKLASQTSINEDFSLECLITDSFNEANRFIERKHLHNNNEKAWGQFERDNHSVRVKRSGGNAEKSRIKRANIGKLVEEVTLPEIMKQKVLGPGFITNFYRLVDSSPGQKYFGFSVNDDGEIETQDKEALLKKLKVFIYDLLTSKPEDGQSWSRAYNKTEEKEEYLKNLDLSEINKIDEKIESSKTKNLLGEEEIQLTDDKGRSIFSRREVKVPPTLIKYSRKHLQVSKKSQKIDDIYKELQFVMVKECPHAVSMLIRTLTELSVNRFLEVNGETFTKDGALKVTGAKPRSELKQKIVYIAENYACSDANLKAKMLALHEDLFTQSLNQVVHNIGYFASEKEVRDFWKTLDGVIEYLVEGIIQKENDTATNS